MTGAVDPVAVTEALVAGVRALGAQVLVGTAVTALRVSGGTVRGVQTTAGPLAARTVVLAARFGGSAVLMPIVATAQATVGVSAVLMPLGRGWLVGWPRSACSRRDTPACLRCSCRSWRRLKRPSACLR